MKHFCAQFARNFRVSCYEWILLAFDVWTCFIGLGTSWRRPLTFQALLLLWLVNMNFVSNLFRLPWASIQRSSSTMPPSLQTLLSPFSSLQAAIRVRRRPETDQLEDLRAAEHGQTQCAARHDRRLHRHLREEPQRLRLLPRPTEGRRGNRHPDPPGERLTFDDVKPAVFLCKCVSDSCQLRLLSLSWCIGES